MKDRRNIDQTVVGQEALLGSALDLPFGPVADGSPHQMPDGADDQDLHAGVTSADLSFDGLTDDEPGALDEEDASSSSEQVSETVLGSSDAQDLSIDPDILTINMPVLAGNTAQNFLPDSFDPEAIASNPIDIGLVNMPASGLPEQDRPIYSSEAETQHTHQHNPVVVDSDPEFVGPPPPHAFGQSGCGCAGCGNMEFGAGGNRAEALGAPAPATSLDNLSRYLSEYNHPNTADDDFWDEFWGPPSQPNFHWNLLSTGTNAQSGTISFNVDGNSYDANGLGTAQRKEAIRNAFDVYEDILGINFVETNAQNADINFGDAVSGRAFANFNHTNGVISNAWINIASNWSGTGLIGDYYFQTALHEIGHTLGLGHSGLYNAGQGNPSYNDSYWANDTTQYTMMSYWAQNNYTAAGESTPSGAFLGNVDLIGLQAVDWLALNRMYDHMGYGINDGATTGDTTWGFNDSWGTSNAPPVSNLLNNAFNSISSLLHRTSLTIVDGGGIDTLDLSGFSDNTKIDVSEVLASDVKPSMSNVAGLVGNLMIGVGTVIENVVGGSNDELIIGNSANNVINGGAGSDDMRGGLGNDRYIVGVSTDIIQENSGEGYDTVWSYTVNYTLSDFIERLDLLGAARNGTGNDQANTIVGNNNNNTINGAGGNDVLVGGGGNDLIFGGTGNDIMNGGSGNDIYFFNSGDTIIEATFSSGGGIDTMYSSTSTTIVTNVEILRLFGTDHLVGNGSAAPESIVGNSGNNLLRGFGSNDTINGKGGNDIISGGTGRDVIVGDTGADIFNYDNVNESRVGSSNRDFINGFEHGLDRIDLSDIDANTGVGGNQAFTYVGNSAFSGSAGELRYFTFGNVSIVEADVNGDSNADMQIFINGTNYMTGSDFIA